MPVGVYLVRFAPPGGASGAMASERHGLHIHTLSSAVDLHGGCWALTQPSERDIRARNAKFAKRARETQNVRNAGGVARGLVHKSEEEKRDEHPPAYARYLSLFCLVLLGGGCTWGSDAVILELAYLFFRS